MAIKPELIVGPNSKPEDITISLVGLVALRRFIDQDLKENVKEQLKKGHELNDLIAIYLVNCVTNEWAFKMLGVEKPSSNDIIVRGVIMPFSKQLMSRLRKGLPVLMHDSLRDLEMAVGDLRVITILGKTLQIFSKDYSYFVDQ